MSAGGYISSNGCNLNINKNIVTVNNLFKTLEIDITVKSANMVIIDNKSFFEITAIMPESLQILYALNGRLTEAENLMERYLYHSNNKYKLKFTYIK